MSRSRSGNVIRLAVLLLVWRAGACCQSGGENCRTPLSELRVFFLFCEYFGNLTLVIYYIMCPFLCISLCLPSSDLDLLCPYCFLSSSKSLLHLFLLLLPLHIYPTSFLSLTPLLLYPPLPPLLPPIPPPPITTKLNTITTTLNTITVFDWKLHWLVMAQDAWSFVAEKYL